MKGWAKTTFEEHGIEVVPFNVVPGFAQTRAVGTLERLRSRYGEDHARLVVMSLSDTSNNKAYIDAVTISAVSDTIRIAERLFPDLMANDIERWFVFMDTIPLGQLNAWTIPTAGIYPRRHALAGMIFERLIRVFGEMATQGDLLDDRRRT